MTVTEKHFTLAKVASGFLENVLGEKGFLFTLIQFLIRPGVSLRLILEGRQGNFLEPIRFVLYSVTLAAVAMNLVGVRGFSGDFSQVPDIRQADEQLHETAANLQKLRDAKGSSRETRFRIDRALADLKQSELEWRLGVFMQWMNVFLLIAVPIYAMGTWLLFPRGMNLAEHLVVNSYIYGVQCCQSMLLAPLGLWDYWMYSMIYLVVAQIYQFFAWHQTLKFQTWIDWILCGVLVGGSLVVYFLILVVCMVVLLITIMLSGL